MVETREWDASRAVPKPEGKKKGGKGPRASGTRVERLVAKATGGERTPGSGAFKNTNRNLEGDVEIPDADGKPFIKVEVKACGIINTKGEKSYALSLPVINQMYEEAEKANEMGLLWVHFKGQPIEEGLGLMKTKHLLELIELAKLGATMRK